MTGIACFDYEICPTCGTAVGSVNPLTGVRCSACSLPSMQYGGSVPSLAAASPNERRAKTAEEGFPYAEAMPGAYVAPRHSGEFVGFREWNVTDDLTLGPLGIGGTGWTPGVNTAEARRGGMCSGIHEAPATDCECGLYALHAPKPQWGRDWREGTRYGSRVVGVVAAWGNVDVQPTGFRAQYAQPVVLGLNDDARRRERVLTMHLARDYHCETVPVEYLLGAALEHGSPVPPDLYPQGSAPDESLLSAFQMMARAMDSWSASCKRIGDVLQAYAESSDPRLGLSAAELERWLDELE